MTLTRGVLVAAATGNPPAEYIRTMAAKGFDVTVGELTGRSRAYPLVEYRQVAMTAIRDLCNLSFPAIGDMFHRDHTTVMHAVEKVREGEHHPPGSKRRKLWDTMDLLCREVRHQWAIETGEALPPVVEFI